MTRRRVVPALVAGLLVGAGLSGCGDDAAAGSSGDVLVGHVSDDVSGDSAYVLLPTGRIDLTVGEPTDKVSADQAADGRAHAAPDGGSWLPVRWEHDPFGEGAVPVAVMGADPQEADVALVVDGTGVDLGSPYEVVSQGTGGSGASTRYVAVDAAPADIGDVSFEVTYDGLTQTVHPATGERDAGAAAPLYDEPTMGIPAPCTSEGFASGRVTPAVSCLVNAPQRTPYLPGHGWAKDGRTWVLVPVDIALDSVDVAGTSYDVTSVGLALALDGQDPLPADDRYGTPESGADTVRGTWAFDADAAHLGDLTLALDCTLHSDGAADPGPGSRQVTLTQDVPLG